MQRLKINIMFRNIPIRLAVKSINDDLEEAGLPTISKNSEGELSIQGKDQIHIKKFEKFIQNYNFYSYTMTKTRDIQF